MAPPIVHTAHIEVLPDAAETFLKRLLLHATISRSEPGCLRFDVYRDNADRCRFWLNEIYRDDAALKAHRGSAHFLAFRKEVDSYVVNRSWWYWEQMN